MANEQDARAAQGDDEKVVVSKREMQRILDRNTALESLNNGWHSEIGRINAGLAADNRRNRVWGIVSLVLLGGFFLAKVMGGH
jgi:hypothetical protein